MISNGFPFENAKYDRNGGILILMKCLSITASYKLKMYTKFDIFSTTFYKESSLYFFVVSPSNPTIKTLHLLSWQLDLKERKNIENFDVLNVLDLCEISSTFFFFKRLLIKIS
jgi:hypothetical protein